LSMEHFSRYALIAQKWLNTALTCCKQLQVIALVLVCRCGMWGSSFELYRYIGASQRNDELNGLTFLKQLPIFIGTRENSET
jgi:hypothetical protein